MRSSVHATSAWRLRVELEPQVLPSFPCRRIGACTSLAVMSEGFSGEIKGTIWLQGFMLFLVRMRIATAIETGNLRSAVCSTDFHEHERHIISGGTFAPGRNAIEDALLHFTERQEGGLADKFLQAFDAEHFPARIEHFGDAVRVEDDAVLRLQFNVDGFCHLRRVGERAEYHVARFQQPRFLSRLHDYDWRVTRPGKGHAPSAALDSHGRECQKES